MPPARGKGTYERHAKEGEALIITRTPFRVSLVGGGTDYDAWFEREEGLVVGGAIDKFCYVQVRHLPPFHDYKTRVVYSRTETVRENADIEHPLVRACIEACGLGGEALEVIHWADLPGRSGTGSSSAFAVGLINALDSLGGHYSPPEMLAAAATNVERKTLGESGGRQDQLFAAHGGLRAVRFRPGLQITATPLALSADHRQELEEVLLLFFTGISRTSAEVAATYAGTLGERTAEQRAMLRYAEAGLDAVRRRDWEGLGKAVDGSWRVKSGLSEAVSSPDIARLYSTARVCGAWGGKITGAGGGGCLLLVAPPDKRNKLVNKLTAEGCVHIPFSFTDEGSSVVYAGGC